jgi:hypothetical protein
MGKNKNEAISRPLTAREIRFVWQFFGNAIDYKSVRIHNTRFLPTQGSHWGMSPFGEIYCPPAIYKDDYSYRVTDLSFLAHELTHVYQYQHGTRVWLRGLFERFYKYGDLTNTKKTLSDFNIEQQGAIVEDYVRLVHGAKPFRGTGSRADYERVITFLPINQKRKAA